LFGLVLQLNKNYYYFTAVVNIGGFGLKLNLNENNFDTYRKNIEMRKIRKCKKCHGRD